MGTPPTVVLLHGVQSSASSFWRVAPDLRDLGCEVRTLDLLGHGNRSADGRAVSLASLAEDVAVQLDEQPVDLLVGHSLGALVGLTLATRRPDLLGGLVLEDPPALGPDLDPVDVAANIERETARARHEPLAMEADLRVRNPLWARTDVANDVANLLSLDVPAVTAWLRSERWDLGALIRGCPVPVHLLLAGEAQSATTDPARSDVVRFLGPERVTQVDSSHSIHRDRPGVWVATVLMMLSARRTETVRPGP